MISYRLKLTQYHQAQKLIADDFFSATVAAEETCNKVTHSKTTNFEQDAAQAVLKSEFRAASRVRSAALKALGPPPNMAIG